ncbi:hypothetical protein F4802DRAFT_522336 [Xylaria palmicola]|nr:hypothetical protein F4802DRAFT_522336 [Xylaria palmicola]
MSPPFSLLAFCYSCCCYAYLDFYFYIFLPQILRAPSFPRARRVRILPWTSLAERRYVLASCVLVNSGRLLSSSRSGYMSSCYVQETPNRLSMCFEAPTPPLFCVGTCTPTMPHPSSPLPRIASAVRWAATDPAPSPYDSVALSSVVCNGNGPKASAMLPSSQAAPQDLHASHQAVRGDCPSSSAARAA